MQEMIGLTLAKAKKLIFLEMVEVVGEIAQETENVTHITSTQSGYLQRYLVEMGQTVDEGTPLCEIKTNAGEMFQIKATSHGSVWAMYLKEGDYLDNLTSVMTIADPDLLRANFDVYEKDLSKVRVGQKVEVQTIAYGDEKFNGKVAFISPRIDPDSRTIKIRVDIENEDHRLKFGMFVTGEILVESDQSAILIPGTTVQTLEGENVVFIPQAKDEFAIREVFVGRKSGKNIEILSGLHEGETIVDKGSFYLKSEAQKGQFGDGHNH
jgi:cobalt-zinc-cadmium efflux system membrane fusion protein